MPTGYAARLYDGPQTFEDFVRGAARGMGAFMHLREGDAATPLTYPEDDRPRAKQRFKDALRENTIWRMASEEKKYGLWSEYVADVESLDYEHTEFYDRRQRFDDMIERVQNTVVPPELESFKSFMLQQLGTEFEHSREPYMPRVLDFYEWCDATTESKERREQFARDDFRRARARYAEIVHYIDLLAETFGFEVEGRERTGV